jgi:rare lipoprotein A
MLGLLHRFRHHVSLSAALVVVGGLLPQAGAVAAQGHTAPRIAPAVRDLTTVPYVAKAPSVARIGRSAGVGQASFYGRGDGFAGRKTANGEVFDPAQLTAAHRTLPLGSRLKVTNLANHKSVVVRVNDRGPYAKGRILDLSYGAAQRLGMIQAGHAQVALERV